MIISPDTCGGENFELAMSNKTAYLLEPVSEDLRSVKNQLLCFLNVAGSSNPRTKSVSARGRNSSNIRIEREVKDN